MQKRLRYISRATLDITRYDECIATAANGRIYAFSFYLDKMAEDWDALVMDDYTMVMPLPFRRKFGIHYLYQPFVTAQLGVFGNELSPDIFRSFLSAIPKKFRLWEFPLNHGNLYYPEGYDVFDRQNFVLSLHINYDRLYAGYRENLKRNIRKAEKLGCRSSAGIGIDKVIDLSRAKNSADGNYEGFRQVFAMLEEQGSAKTYGVYDVAGMLIASAAFLFSHGRAYYLLVGNHPNGRTLGASHQLIDAFIRDHAGMELTLDFEGSDIRNLAFFYAGFGASQELYTAIKKNDLPWYLRLLKK